MSASYNFLCKVKGFEGCAKSQDYFMYSLKSALQMSELIGLRHLSAQTFSLLLNIGEG